MEVPDICTCSRKQVRTRARAHAHKEASKHTYTHIQSNTYSKQASKHTPTRTHIFSCHVASTRTELFPGCEECFWHCGKGELRICAWVEELHNRRRRSIQRLAGRKAPFLSSSSSQPPAKETTIESMSEGRLPFGVIFFLWPGRGENHSHLERNNQLVFHTLLFKVIY